MSATTELLIEDIQKTEAKLAEAQAAGDAVTTNACVQALKSMRKQLERANQALTESKQSLLKG